MTTYTFMVKTSDVGGGCDGLDPTYDKIIRKLECDAQAEAHARAISSTRGKWVQIKRADASWGLSVPRDSL